MADLDYAHSDMPVVLTDDATGNLAGIRIDGSLDVSPTLIGRVKEKGLYGVAIDVVAATGNTDNPVLLLRNPNGSGKTLYIYLVSGNTTITNVSVEFKVFADPTVTANGTSQTSQSRYVGGGAGTAVGLVTTLPTVTSNGAALATSTTGQNSSDVDIVNDFSIAIAPNHSILITASPSSNNRNVAIELSWLEA